MADDPRVAALGERFPGEIRYCGLPEGPGIMDRSEWRDWSTRTTTADQLRIEDFLETQPLQGKRILHIGSGNSELARRFAGRAAAIVGTTVVPEEKDIGDAIGIANYRCLLHNKYAGAQDLAGEKFDYIVDNNPTTFACCKTHIFTMLDFYRDALAPGGLVVTDRIGLKHNLAQNDATHRFGCRFAQFRAAASMAGLQARRFDRFTYLLGTRFPRRRTVRQLFSAMHGWLRDVAGGLR